MHPQTQKFFQFRHLGRKPRTCAQVQAEPEGDSAEGGWESFYQGFDVSMFHNYKYRSF